MRDLAKRCDVQLGNLQYYFATLIYLCMHKPEFLELKKRIYRAFYESLESLIRSLDTEVTPVELRQRVALITAMMDGSVVQSTGGSRTFVDAVVTTVTGVAHGRSGSGL